MMPHAGEPRETSGCSALAPATTAIDKNATAAHRVRIPGRITMRRILSSATSPNAATLSHGLSIGCARHLVALR